MANTDESRSRADSRDHAMTRDRSRQIGVACTAALVATWFVITLLRLEPRLHSDAGLFLAMFEAVADGDRLYVDIWDHKDPVFFWLGALSFSMFGGHGPAIFDALFLLIIGFAGQRLALDRSCSPAVALLIGIGAMGFTTNPAFHATGLTEPPAIALLLAAYVLVGRGRVIAAFVLVSLLVPIKLAFILLAIPVVFAGYRSKQVSLAYQAVALAGPTLLIMIVLALRGELAGWIDSIFFNRAYSSEGPQWFGASTSGIPGHIQRLFTIVGGSPSLIMTTLLLLVAAGAIWKFGTRDSPDRARPMPASARSAAIWFAVSMTLTFLTAHMLRAAVPMIVLVAISLHHTALRRGTGIASILAVGLLMGVASGPHPSDIQAVTTIGERWGAIDTTSADQVQSIIDEIVPTGHVAMAVSIGSPRDAFLPFLDDRVKLVCPSHHMLPWFESRFADHEECIATQADVVIVGHTDFANTAPMIGHSERIGLILDQDFGKVTVVRRRPGLPNLTIWLRNS